MTHHRGRWRLALGAVAALALAYPGAADAHITPVVVLHKQADVIRARLPDATGFFVTDVAIGREDLQRIKDTGHFTPEAAKVKFYSGKNAQGAPVGVVLFPQLDTPHGPLEIGLTLGADGRVTSVVVTRATVESKPWIERVVRAGVLKRFQGLAPGGDAHQAVAAVKLGGRPGYFVDAIATAVQHGLALYGALYAKG